MANDLFGGLVKGLGAFMPKDDPNIMLFKAQTEMSDLDNREQEIYAEIGKKVYSSICENPEYSDLVSELNFIIKKREAAKQELQQAQESKTEREKEEQQNLQTRTCPNCSSLNPEGVKFCQECGSRLNQATKITCQGCGAEFPIGTKFCGECGRQL